MEAGKLSFTVCEAFGLSSEMVTLREPTLRGDRGERGGETESSDMLVGCGRRGKSSLGDCFEEQPAGGRAQPQAAGSVGAKASGKPLEAVRNL